MKIKIYGDVFRETDFSQVLEELDALGLDYHVMSYEGLHSTMLILRDSGAGVAMRGASGKSPWHTFCLVLTKAIKKFELGSGFEVIE